MDQRSGEAGAPAAASGDELLQWVWQQARRHGFEPDDAQCEALRHFQRLRDEVVDLERREDSLLGRFLRRREVPGLYLWGGVGRGKSFLMDCFFHCLPLARKRRVHFHRYMQSIHHALNRHQGEEDPLRIIARETAREVRVLCLDEFHVTDITDAMLMRRLLEGLFEQGVVLVTTSNIHPDKLYEHGLQRTQFLPAIELIKERLTILNVDQGVDYRLRELERAGVYHTGAEADVRLAAAFASIAADEDEEPAEMEIEERVIRARRVAHGVAWFDFVELCDGPRGKADYIELARRFHTVILSNIPTFGPRNADVVRRFTWLVDEFYDRRVKLIISAAAPPDSLYPIAEGGDQFLRTVSRLVEMQTHQYLSEPHLP